MNGTEVIPSLIMGPIYPEWIVDREVRKMERREKRKRTREGVLRYMEEHNEKPMRICLKCDHVCINRKVVGLVRFHCAKRGWK